MQNKRVFVIHGHDSAAMFELKDFLAGIGLEPMLLFQQDDQGMTIVEKFEHYASQCAFAIALLTPDDKQATELSGDEMWRARQNVILELGWFMRKVGRSGVVMLHKGTVELPSDLTGVLYLPFDKSIYEVSEKLRQRLSGAGLL